MMRLLLVVLLSMFVRFAVAASLPDPVRFSIVMEQGDLSTARDWLDSGLDPNFEGSVIGTGLMIAAWEGNVPLMELFHARGADIDRSNRFGEQALQHAAWRGKLAAVRWLVDHGARLNRDGKQWSALHYAVFAGHGEVVAYLLARGADINALSTNGSTPLMMAAREGREAIARSLLSAGARRDIVNDNGENAVHWAMRHNNLSIAREIGGAASFAVAAAQPAVTWGPAVRSQPVPDRADALIAQARKMEAAGRREDALALYRSALTAIRQADASRKLAAPARAASGLVITARRDKPESQTATLNYATPAQPQLAAAGAAGDASDEILRRARDFEAAGKRKEALQAYREAAALLRSGGSRAAAAPITAAPRAETPAQLPPP